MKKLIRWIIGIGGTAALIYFLNVPYVPALKDHNPTTTSYIELRKAQARAARRTLATRRVWANLDRISPHLIHAVLLAEDDRFYEHHGFDLEQILIAFKRDWAKKRYVYGGSTLTQQLARTLYLSPRKNLFRKVKEAEITVWMEYALSKHRILELYLNNVEWGKGIYGAQAAAQFYYGKDASVLTPDEAVALASILPSPRRWSPLSEQSFMERRRTQLTERMEQAGYILAVSSTDPLSIQPFLLPDDLSDEEQAPNNESEDGR